MKNIKLRIVYLILGAALLLFALFMLAVNVMIPAHFVREAEKALISEAQYENRTIPYTYEGAGFLMMNGTTGRRSTSSRPALYFLSWRMPTNQADGAGTPIGWRKTAGILQ